MHTVRTDRIRTYNASITRATYVVGALQMDGDGWDAEDGPVRDVDQVVRNALSILHQHPPRNLRDAGLLPRLRESNR
jgi:hypothetical protein